MEGNHLEKEGTVSIMICVPGWLRVRLTHATSSFAAKQLTALARRFWWREQLWCRPASSELLFVTIAGLSLVSLCDCVIPVSFLLWERTNECVSENLFVKSCY